MTLSRPKVVQIYLTEDQLAFLKDAVETIREENEEFGLTEDTQTRDFCNQLVETLSEAFTAEGADEDEPYEHSQCPDCGMELPCDCPQFADPTGHSALRAATPRNPRNLPCPTCGKPNRLTPEDKALHYQCDECADRAERGGY